MILILILILILIYRVILYSRFFSAMWTSPWTWRSPKDSGRVVAKAEVKVCSTTHQKGRVGFVLTSSPYKNMLHEKVKASYDDYGKKERQRQVANQQTEWLKSPHSTRNPRRQRMRTTRLRVASARNNMACHHLKTGFSVLSLQRGITSHVDQMMRRFVTSVWLDMRVSSY